MDACAALAESLLKGCAGVSILATSREEGGTYVRIKGNGFLVDSKGNSAPANAKVYFGSRQGEVVRFASSEELIVQAPGGKVNESVDVLIIFEGRGELKIPHGFTFIDKKETGATLDDINTNKPEKK